jgi:hypothetical protein
MLYEITLENALGQRETINCDLELSSELTWQEFCSSELFQEVVRPWVNWRVADITPTDLITIDQDTATVEVVQEIDVNIEISPSEEVDPEPLQEPEPKINKPKFIDSWSGRSTKNTEFTQWMMTAKQNGIPNLTFKSRVYKMRWDYLKAATMPVGAQGHRQKRIG